MLVVIFLALTINSSSRNAASHFGFFDVSIVCIFVFDFVFLLIELDLSILKHFGLLLLFTLGISGVAYVGLAFVEAFLLLELCVFLSVLVHVKNNRERHIVIQLDPLHSLEVQVEPFQLECQQRWEVFELQSFPSVHFLGALLALVLVLSFEDFWSDIVF